MFGQLRVLLAEYPNASWRPTYEAQQPATLWCVTSHPTLRSFTFPAMGTTATLIVTDPDAGERAHELLRDELEVLDRTCSRFRDDSELVRLNRESAGTVAITPALQEYLQVALDVADETDGAVDPTVGMAMVARGYDRPFDRVKARQIAVGVRRVPARGWRSLTITDGEIERPSALMLDLGATAKAHAADRAAHAIVREFACGVLVSLGGDIAVEGACPSDGWPVRITDDHRDRDGAGPVVALRTGGLATSSTTVRRWPTTSGVTHHIVVPATGAAAPDVWRTVSVAASTCVAANAASTAAIVKGHRALDWLRERGHCARLVATDGAVVTTGGWPAE